MDEHDGVSWPDVAGPNVIEQAGVGNLLIQFHFGNMKPELARKSMRLFATEVAPALRKDSAALFGREYPQ